MLLFYGLILWCGLASMVSAGVFPNYHGQFDFISWDKEKSLHDYENTKKWWETAAFYQIYPRSFKDSNEDGVGDLKGITEQLPYLQEIGINATWLSPIFPSPMADFGYDISNFTDIDPLFGTMQDFEDMIAKAKELNIKIILDFVPNHSSDECEWFQKSIAEDPHYKDMYVWHPGKIIDGKRQPPTNWRSVFRGSAWQWHEKRKAYYLHQFGKKQPDLNYRLPQVKEMMKEVMRFWLRKGVAGFRIDSVAHVYEVAPNSSGDWPDEPRNMAVNDPDDWSYLQHIYTVDQPESTQLLYEWRKVLDDFQQEHGGDELIIMAETYSPIEVIMKYYGNDTVNGVQIPFNFLLITWLTNASSAYDYAKAIHTWLDNMPNGRTANWVLGNHDQHRLASRLGEDRVDMMNILLLTLPGCSVTYMGEEIGMSNVWISWNDTVDPSACNSNPNIYEKLSRDPERTPFQWSDEYQAGFTTAKKTWLPLALDYEKVNVKEERKVKLSHLDIYKQLQELRKQPTLRHGLAEIVAINNNVLAVKRYLLKDYTYVTLMNINDNRETFNLLEVFSDLPEEMMYVVVTKESERKIGTRVHVSSVQLNPKEAVILQSLTQLSTTAGYFVYYTHESPKNKIV
uniref:alpha-glucosidase n=1 Tax=Glossina morsitans morsitans TaxID=37546 RepID=A0A1B0GBF8_GLOMM